MICKICGLICKSNVGLSTHLKHSHNLNFLEYYKSYDIDKLIYCEYCGDICKLHGSKFRKTCGSKKCISMANQIPHTEDTKELLRRQRFEFLLKKTGKTAWERKNNGEMSLLEEWFFDNIICKHKLYEKYDIVNEHPEYPYFIDFAFLNIKLAVELDGQQHFKNGKKRIENDIKKDKLLNTKDWKVIRFSYDEDKIKIEKRFIDILNNIKNTNNKKLNNYIYKGKLKKLLPDRNWNQYILDRK